MAKPLLLALLACLAVAGCSDAPATSSAEPVEQLRTVAAVPRSDDPEIAAFYSERGGRSLWTDGSAADRLLAVLSDARSDGLDPGRYRVDEIAAALRQGDPQALARADLLLSEALVRYSADLRTLLPAARPTYAEKGLAPVAPAARALLDSAAAAPDRRTYADNVRRLNPVYDGLREGLAAYRRRWSRLPQLHLPERPHADQLRRRLGLAAGGGLDRALVRALAAFKRAHGLPETPGADSATIAALNAGPGHYERLIRINMERARALPRSQGRSVLVDTAAARLWMFEGDRTAGHMRVIVGKRGMETPALAGRIRYAVLNPYWNLPVDLARQRAQWVLRRGTRVLAAERLQILSQFSADDRVLSPASVNWGRVAAGREPLRLRQLPGGGNVMGAVKFMLPNNLDIYLHDFPDKSLFGRADRRLSSGCVRLEDAQRLAAWLFGGAAPRPDGPRPEQRVDLPQPVPVFITYLTAVPAGGEVAFQPDAYGRDATLLAALDRAESGGVAA
jgi:murein L,D-transpeptidase YcbB/YkuD